MGEEGVGQGTGKRRGEGLRWEGERLSDPILVVVVAVCWVFDYRDTIFWTS